MVHTTKVDQEYPDHLLSGAIFEVYRDENGNKEFDADIDTLVAELVEYEPGLYELENLRYGGYFLYEKQAPDNFLKDNGYYYFEIVNDGEMVEVENEAGIGFINNPMRGNLKIVKTSSDGRVEGFSFRVTGENYDEVFKTDSNGEIVIENLRIGKYTVMELEDEVSAGYDRPDPVEVRCVYETDVSYVYYNYLPNIAGISTSGVPKPANPRSASSYNTDVYKRQEYPGGVGSYQTNGVPV